MATTTIKKISVGDLTVIIKKEKTAADRIEAMLEWLADKIEEAVGNTPDWGVGEGSPDNTLPGGGGRPGAGAGQLPSGPGGSTKPVDPDEGKPDNTLPGSGGSAGQLPSGGGGSTKPTPPSGGSAGQLPSGGGGGGGSTKPVEPTEPGIEQLPALIRDNMTEVINELLKGTPCAPQPK